MHWIKLGMLAAVAALCAAFATPAPAAVIEGVRFDEQVAAGESQLRLHGTGLLRYRVLFRGYVAALYLHESFGSQATPETVLDDVPRRLEIEYFWSIDAEDFARVTIAGIEQSSGAAVREALSERISALNALYRDVEPGDRYSLTYLPEVGTELALNGRRLGVIPGATFARALFAIWLGDRPLDRSLRDQLLAQP